VQQERAGRAREKRQGVEWMERVLRWPALVKRRERMIRDVARVEPGALHRPRDVQQCVRPWSSSSAGLDERIEKRIAAAQSLAISGP
jgi:hypothetical protein